MLFVHQYPLFNKHRRCGKFLFAAAFPLLVVFCFFPTAPTAHALQVTLAWDSNRDPGIAGYKVYCGTSTRDYSASYDAGLVYSYAVSDLQAGTTYYFAATAYDRHGNESAFSEEVTYVAPAPNNPPIAQEGVFSTHQDTPVSGVLIAADPEGHALTYRLAAQGSMGTLTLHDSAAGTFTYLPHAGVTGDDSFTFQVVDPGGLTATATVAVRIVSLSNKPPVASSGTVTTFQDTPISGSLSANDGDGEVLEYKIASAPTLGSLSLDAANGTFTYTPIANTTGTDTFTFKANDGREDSNAAAFDVIINAHAKIVLEAADGSLSAPMTRAKDPKADGGKYIRVRNGKGDVTDSLNQAGQALYSFSAPTAGNYEIWARVAASNVKNNSFLVSLDYGAGIAWHTAIGAKSTWFWDRIKGKNDPTPTSFYLDAGMHTLVIRPMEDGTKLDSLLITTDAGWMGEKVCGDAEDEGTDGWEVFDASPAGALISNVFDEDRGGYVIELSGSRKQNGYRLRWESLGNRVGKGWSVIQWSMKYNENFVISVAVQTTAGIRQLQYRPVNADHLGTSRRVRLGLGTGAIDGEWHTFVRDLQADLSRAQEGVEILQVKSFAVRGSGRIDDIKWRESL